MASDAVLEFSDDNFSSEVLAADGAVLVDFGLRGVALAVRSRQ